MTHPVLYHPGREIFVVLVREHSNGFPLGGSCHKAVEDWFVTDEGNNVASIEHFSIFRCGPLIRPFGAPSSQGEGIGAPAPVR